MEEMSASKVKNCLDVKVNLYGKNGKCPKDQDFI